MKISRDANFQSLSHRMGGGYACGFLVVAEAVTRRTLLPLWETTYLVPYCSFREFTRYMDEMNQNGSFNDAWFRPCSVDALTLVEYGKYLPESNVWRLLDVGADDWVRFIRK